MDRNQNKLNKTLKRDRAKERRAGKKRERMGESKRIRKRKDGERYKKQ
jgi:hypothetical protein